MITQLLTAIKDEILTHPEYQSCFIYPTPPRFEVLAPAVFLEVGGYSPGDDPGTEETALVVNIEARVVVDSTIANAELSCQTLACNLARISRLNNFGCHVSPAKLYGISRDSFVPELDQYICWMVEWYHEFHLGENAWWPLEPIIPPHLININGVPL